MTFESKFTAFERADYSLFSQFMELIYIFLALIV